MTNLGKLWDICCALSIVGIWPRFVEPSLLSIKNIELPVPSLPKELDRLRIAQFSDLHLNEKMPRSLIKKMIRKINDFDPDITVFTGDFLCYSTLFNKEELSAILNKIKGRYGRFAIAGNHDYEKTVSLNLDTGDYDIRSESKNELLAGLRRLFLAPTISGKASCNAKRLKIHPELQDLIPLTSFELLHNETKIVSIKDAAINICGLGEYTLGKTDPATAFNNYNTQLPGVVLLHNPDGIPLLKNYPGEVVLCGHTHGGQINIPFLWNRLSLLEHPQYKKGLIKEGDKWIYINRGLGSVVPFRLGSIPEVTLLTLHAKNRRTR